MYRATYPPIRVITAAQQAWNPRITSRRSSGSSLAARVVEPTRSQKRTVSWRLSGSDCGRAGAVAGAPAVGVAPDSAAIALRIRFRWPSATPNLSRSVSVTSGKTSRSTAFSAKTVAYCPSPISSSQVFIWSLTLTVACSPRPPKVLLHFPLSLLHTLLCARRDRSCRPHRNARKRPQPPLLARALSWQNRSISALAPRVWEKCAGSLLLSHHLRTDIALVALTPSGDLFICAKDLFFEAIVP